MRIKSALEMKQRPTAALREEGDPYTGWVSHDYRLMEAMTIMEAEKCGKCGNPVWLCHTTSSSVEFEIEKITCYGSAELEDYQKNKQNVELDAGEYLTIKAVGIKNEDGTYDPLPSRAEAMKLLP